MREIKFRAWHNIHGMIHPDEFFRLQDAVDCNLDFFGSPSKDYETNDFIFEQFTGLKDKNGEEVYKNDLMTDLLHTYKVVWDKTEARFLLEDIVEPKNLLKASAIPLLRKVGNVHENPELLDEGK